MRWFARISNTEPGRVCIFLHNMKVAGTTLNDIFKRQYKRGLIFKIQGRRMGSHIDELRNMADEDKRTYRAVIGHMYFGLHGLLPMQSLYVTLLREPVGRTISLYNYYISERNEVEGINIRAMQYDETISEFMNGGYSLQADNGQTRFISGWKDVPYGECSAEMLEAAKENLEHYFEVVGLQERFDESVFLIASKLNWSYPYYIQRNAGVKKNTVLNEAEMDLVKSYNKYDIELYRYATDMCNKQIDDMGEKFAAEFKIFCFLNRYFGSFYVNAWEFLSAMKARYKRFFI